MRGRPLCVVCLIFLLINGIRLLMMSGDAWVQVPADSIFSGFCGFVSSDSESAREKTADALVQGCVYKKSNTLKNQVLYLKNNSITYQNQIYNESKIIIYDKTFSNIPIGTTIQIYGRLGVFEEARNPGNFDAREYYAKQGIYGFCNLEEVRSVTKERGNILEDGIYWLKERLHLLRKRWKELLLINMSENNGPILSAMLLAEKSEMDPDLKELYQKSGISHILAISGLHVSFIGLGIYECLRRKLHLSYGISAGVSVAVLGVYVLMIGGSVSVVRAFIMLLLRIGAEVTGRVYDMPTALALSAAIAVAYNPFHLTDAGFYMSYGAIVGIVVVLPRIKVMWKEKRISSQKGILRSGISQRCSAFGEGCIASMAINLMLFPVLIYFYYEIPTYSVLINALIIPMMSIVLSLGMFGSFLAMCIPVRGKMLRICDWLLTFFAYVCDVGARLPISSIVLEKPAWWSIVVYYGLLLLWMVLKGECYAKLRKYVGLVLMASVLLFIKVPDGKLHVTILDVGQGDCIFLKGPLGQTYLVDGGSSDVKQVGKYRIEPYLRSQGVGQLDYVFISHGDADHCNGILEILERQKVGVKVKNLVLPVNYSGDEMLVELARLAKEHGVRVLCIGAGQEVSEGDLRIECLQPENQELDGNAGSMVLSVTFKEFEMLLTGDVEGEGEELLVKTLGDKADNIAESYDVLKVAHHGSKNSTTEELLNQINPKLALISAGEGNRYGHPHKETLERLKGAKCKVLETGECGAITLEVGEEIKVSRWIKRGK